MQQTLSLRNTVTAQDLKVFFSIIGHYSVVEPDGSTRTVEYSAGPNTGFQAVVNTENQRFDSEEIGSSIMEEKAMRDFDKYYDFSEDGDEDYYERRRPTKKPYEPVRKEYSNKKRTKYPSYADQPLDSEPSDYTHSISIKHPREEYSEFEPQSHVGYNSDPKCKTKTRKESHNNRDNLYSNIVDLELNKKYPPFPSDSFRDTYDKYAEPSSDFDRYVTKHYGNGNFKGHKYDDIDNKPTSLKYTFPVIPDVPPPEKYFPDEVPSRPKKKRPYKREPEHRFPSEDLSDYVLVPKKKLKKPRPTVEPYDYRVPEDDYERPHYLSNYDDTSHDDRYPSFPRGEPPKEVVRKIVKKRKPVINLLDMFDI